MMPSPTPHATLAPPRSCPGVLRLVGWIATLAVILRVLLAADGPLPEPSSLVSPDAWTDWSATTDPAIAAFTVVRLCAVAVACYLLAATILATVAHLSGRLFLIRVADLVSVPLVKRVVHRTVGVGLAVTFVGVAAPLLTAGVPTAVAAPVTEVRDTGPDDPTATMELVDDGPNTTTTTAVPVIHLRVLDEPTAPTTPTTVEVATPPVVRMVPLDAGPVDATTSPTTRVPAAAAGAEPSGGGSEGMANASVPAPETSATEDRVAASDDTLARWTIEPGDHLWHVSEAVVQTIEGREPTVTETASYLDALIAANRSVLVVPDNPDLVFPGQVFTLPPVVTP